MAKSYVIIAEDKEYEIGEKFEVFVIVNGIRGFAEVVIHKFPNFTTTAWEFCVNDIYFYLISGSDDTTFRGLQNALCVFVDINNNIREMQFEGLDTVGSHLVLEMSTVDAEMEKSSSLMNHTPTQISLPHIVESNVVSEFMPVNMSNPQQRDIEVVGRTNKIESTTTMKRYKRKFPYNMNDTIPVPIDFYITAGKFKESNNFTNKQLANLLNISEKYVSRIVTNKISNINRVVFEDFMSLISEGKPKYKKPSRRRMYTKK